VEDIIQETVDFGWGSCTEGIEDLTATPDLPRLDGKLHDGGIIFVIAVPQESEHAIANGSTNKLAM